MAALIALTACGGGGGSDGGGTTANTGSASVFLTDAASDDFDRILVTFEDMKLIGEGGQVTLFTGEETIDLKDLEDFSDLFVYAEHVPARRYSKIRLLVRRIQLVEDGPDGEVIEAEVPANGKLDIIPDEKIVIRPGVNLVIELDVDARRSVVRTGNGRYKFVPVIKVLLRESVAPDKLARVHGEITTIFDDQNFELCSTIYMASLGALESTAGSPSSGLGDRHRCMTVELDDRTGVFDPNGDPVDAADLMVGDAVTVVGHFHLVDANHDPDGEVAPLAASAATSDLARIAHHVFAHRKHEKHKKVPDDDDDDDDDGDDAEDDRDYDGDDGDRPSVQIVFIAFVVEIGPPGTFLHLRGEVASEPNDSDEFDFEIAPDQGFGSDSIVAALLQTGTRIFARSGVELDASEIIPGTEAKLDGIFRSNTGDGSVLKTALVVLDVDPDVVEALRGRILEIDDVLRRLLIDVDDAGASRGECVDVPDDADIFVVRTQDGATSKERAGFEDLEEGWRLDAFGRFEGGLCFVADTILAFAEVVPESDCSASNQCATGQFCDKPDGRCDVGGLCQPLPGSCTTEFAPVCGCDGTTYGNACQANLAGTTVASTGACGSGV